MSTSERLQDYGPENCTREWVQVAVVENALNGVYRDPSTGRFVSRHAVDARGWTLVVRPLVNVDAVATWVNGSDGASHAHLACRSLRAVESTSAEPALWTCPDCTGVEHFPWEMLHREDHSGGLGGPVAAAILAKSRELGPSTAAVLASSTGCSVGRVYEVARAGGLTKISRGVYA